MALDLLATTIAADGLSTDAIDDIIVIGGCSQLGLFREFLRNDARFRGRYTLADSPEWDVANGAAVVGEQPGCFVLGESLALQLSDGNPIRDGCPRR
jgi:molecular chaperone DnaK